MPNEALITQIENILSQVVDIGGQQEITSIVTNLEVVDASPAGLTGFITIVDERDGDTILAKTVPGVGYAAADLVNVLFVNGTEPVAFQQASQSSGDPILVSKLVSPDETINPVISADNSGDVTIAGTGDLIVPDRIIRSGDPDNNIAFTDDVQTYTVGGEVLLTLTEAAQDVVKIGDGGDVDINLNDDAFIEGSTSRFAIGTTSPVTTGGGRLQIQGTSANVPAGPHLTFFGSSDAFPLQQMLNFDHDNVNYAFDAYFDGADWRSSDPGSNFLFAKLSDVMRLRYSSGNTAGDVVTWTDGIGLDTAGNFGIATIFPTAQLHVDQDSTTAAEPVLLLDQADVSEEMIEFATTIGVGNAIEAVGAKTLTTTHFIKVTLPGALTRYLEVGTIA